MKKCALHFNNWKILFIKYWLSACQHTGCILCKGLRPSKGGGSGYDTKLHLIVRLQFWSTRDCGSSPSLPFLSVPLTWSRGTSYNPIYESDLFKKLFPFDRTVCKKKLLKNNYKNCKYECDSLTSRPKMCWHAIKINKSVNLSVNHSNHS